MTSSASSDLSLSRRLLLACLSGVLYFVSFVGFGQLYLTWFAFVPVLFAIRGVTPRRALLIGTVFGLVTNLGGYYWVIHLLTDFAYLPIPLATLGYVLLCLYQGFLLAIAIWLVRRADVALGVHPAIGLAVAIPAVEMVYPLLFPSFVGNAQYRFVAITQIVDLFGMLGLEVLIMLVNGAFYELAASRIEQRPLRRPMVLAPAGAFAFALIYGVVRLSSVDASAAEAKKLEVAIVQTNLGSRDKHKRAEEFIQRHIDMTKQLLAEHPEVELVVWPESAYNRYLPRDVKNVRSAVTPGIDRPVIFGALTYDRGPAGRASSYNSAVLTSSTGDVRGIFDKVVLLAFGETLPLSDTFPSLGKLFPHTSFFTRGTRFTPFQLADGTKLLPMICYEDIIPAFVRKMWVTGGPANVLVNVTNDSWYGDTHEPLIHLALASFRSIETRRPLIRSTNTGISALVDPAGRIVRRTGQWTQESLIGQVPVVEGGSTLYMLIGDLIGWIALALVAAAFVAARKRAKSSEAGTGGATRSGSKNARAA